MLREGGQRVLQFAIGFIEAMPEPIALLSLPLGISLPPGAAFQVDEGPSTRVVVERYEPNGCRAGPKLEAEPFNEVRSGKKNSVTFCDAKR